MTATLPTEAEWDAYLRSTIGVDLTEFQRQVVDGYTRAFDAMRPAIAELVAQMAEVTPKVRWFLDEVLLVEQARKVRMRRAHHLYWRRRVR